MNVNEVIARLATQRLGSAVHPNDHVNASQSSNDVFPTSIHLAAARRWSSELLPALDHLAISLERKAAEHAETVKAGRTHLMDATPVTLGQELGGYAAAIRYGVERVEGVPAPGGGAPPRRHGGGHRHQHPARVRRRRRGAAAERTGLPLTEAARPLRGPGRPGRPGGVLRRAADGRREPEQDRQRPALDGRAAPAPGWPRSPAGPAAGQLDHAREGQPGDPGGRLPGGRAGDRQRRRRRLRRGRRHPRAQRGHAGDGAEPAGVDPAARPT